MQIYALRDTNFTHHLFDTVSGGNASQPTTGRPSNFSGAESSSIVSFGQEFHNRGFVSDDNQSHTSAYNSEVFSKQPQPITTQSLANAAPGNSYQDPRSANIPYGRPKKIPPPPPPEFLSKNKPPPPPPVPERSDSAFHQRPSPYQRSMDASPSQFNGNGSMVSVKPPTPPRKPLLPPK